MCVRFGVLINRNHEQFLAMRLSWSILFTFLCNAERVTNVWPPENVNQLTPITPLDGKHLRLITNAVKCLYIIDHAMIFIFGII